MREIAAVGERIRSEGLPEAVRPLVCGFAGYGRVSQGAQEVYNLLGVEEVTPNDLSSVEPSANRCYKVVFREEHMVQRIDGSSPFQLQEYYDHPERYRPSFHPYVPGLTILVNCIYWEPKYPQLVTQEQFGELYGESVKPRLRVVADITADVTGALGGTTGGRRTAWPATGRSSWRWISCRVRCR